MRSVKLPPARRDFPLIPKLSRRRRTTKLDKGRIRPVPQIEQLSVDPLTLPTQHSGTRSLTWASALHA
jgi:hypothetical protein